MSAILTSSMPVARPKIHRMPASHARKPEPVLPKKMVRFSPYIVGGVIVLVLLAAIPPQPHHATHEDNIRKAAVVPGISIKPQDQDIVVIEPHKPAVEAKLAMIDTHALPNNATHLQTNEQLTDNSQGKTIILQGKNEAIIGQMARIPTENEQITEIKSASEVDNKAGRELLSIINKY